MGGGGCTWWSRSRSVSGIRHLIQILVWDISPETERRDCDNRWVGRFLIFLYLFVFFLSLSSFTRDWRYHKEERVWITRAPGMEPTLKTNTYERGTYYFFDCHNWRKVAKVRVQGGLLRCIHWLLLGILKIMLKLCPHLQGISSGVRQAGRAASRAINLQLQSSPAGLLRPDQSKGPQLVLHTALLSWTGTAWFLFLEDSADKTAGVVITIKLSCLFWIYILPCFFVLSRVCVMFTSELKPAFSYRGRTLWPNNGSSSDLQQVFRTQKVGKVRIFRHKWRGERNAMFIVALYLVIK